MMVLGKSVAFFGAIVLMLTILIAERNYQCSFGADNGAQTSTIGAPAPTVSEQIAQANK